MQKISSSCHIKVSSVDRSDMINKDGRLVYWMIFSAVSSVVFAKWAKEIHVYLFLTIAWLFIWILFSQAWGMAEREPEDIAFVTGAATIGFIIGATIVWADDKRHYVAW